MELKNPKADLSTCLVVFFFFFFFFPYYTVLYSVRYAEGGVVLYTSSKMECYYIYVCM